METYADYFFTKRIGSRKPIIGLVDSKKKKKKKKKKQQKIKKQQKKKKNKKKKKINKNTKKKTTTKKQKQNKNKTNKKQQQQQQQQKKKKKNKQKKTKQKQKNKQILINSCNIDFCSMPTCNISTIWFSTYLLDLSYLIYKIDRWTCIWFFSMYMLDKGLWLFRNCFCASTTYSAQCINVNLFLRCQCRLPLAWRHNDVTICDVIKQAG